MWSPLRSAQYEVPGEAQPAWRKNRQLYLDGSAVTVPDGVLYLVEGADGNRDFDGDYAPPRGSGVGLDQDDSATGTFTDEPGLTVPQGPAFCGTADDPGPDRGSRPHAVLAGGPSAGNRKTEDGERRTEMNAQRPTFNARTQASGIL